MSRLALLAAALLATVSSVASAADAYIPSSPDLGKEEARCRPGESGPAFLVSVEGLKDRSGNLKLEVYPAGEDEFLADDNVLVMAGKTFRRVETKVPPAGTPRLCVRVPTPGTYTMMLLHDRDGNRKFGWRVDGVGFSNNPHLGWSKPKAAKVRVSAGAGLTPLTIVLNYQRGLGMAPLASSR